MQERAWMLQRQSYESKRKSCGYMACSSALLSLIQAEPFSRFQSRVYLAGQRIPHGIHHARTWSRHRGWSIRAMVKRWCVIITNRVLHCWTFLPASCKHDQHWHHPKARQFRPIRRSGAGSVKNMAKIKAAKPEFFSTLTIMTEIAGIFRRRAKPIGFQWIIRVNKRQMSRSTHQTNWVNNVWKNDHSPY